MFFNSKDTLSTDDQLSHLKKEFSSQEICIVRFLNLRIKIFLKIEAHGLFTKF